MAASISPGVSLQSTGKPSFLSISIHHTYAMLKTVNQWVEPFRASDIQATAFIKLCPCTSIKKVVTNRWFHPCSRQNGHPIWALVDKLLLTSDQQSLWHSTLERLQQMASIGPKLQFRAVVPQKSPSD